MSFWRSLFKKDKTNFVSEVDQFFEKFDKKHPRKSLSQILEIKKFKRIFFLRDNKNNQENPKNIWDKF